MLTKVCIHLAHEGYSVSVIGRTHTKFEFLHVQSPDHSIFPLIVDYDTDDVFVEIGKALEERGPFDLLVSWTPNYSLLEKVLEMNHATERFRVFHVKGSKRYFEDEPIQVPSECDYREIFLGFMVEEAESRWLTHKEIANGIINRIMTDEEGVIGQIHPYEARPR
ncbi:hypothetical protein [Filibacter tadaridae]|nr:hypothetical protein [Filibacter tadaridae]